LAGKGKRTRFSGIEPNCLREWGRCFNVDLFRVQAAPDSPPLITVVSLESLDQDLLSQTFPFEDPVTVIEFGGSKESVEQMTSTLLETEILVVATQNPERDRYSAEAIGGAAQKASLKVFFTPREVTVGGFTNQVYYSEGFGSLSVQLGRFPGLIVGSYHKWGYCCMSIKDLVGVCKMTNLHYRFYPYRVGNLIQFSKACLLKLENEKIRENNVCCALFFGHDQALVDELSDVAHLIHEWVDRSNNFPHSHFIVGEEHRGISLLID